jgi:predicted DNA-binding transcriptional regulator YafY
VATNKHATIRYHALDRCFSNHHRRFYIEDLIEACNEALYEYTGIKEGVKRRQVYDDITFMVSEQGWSVPLERIRDGRRKYFRYSEKSFSIKNQGINQSEAEQLADTLSILSRFKGLPQFEWVEEMQIRLEDTFSLKGHSDIAVGFEQNPYLKGLNFFTELFNAIQNNNSLFIKYQGFNQPKPDEYTFHPWYLKQFNNRWFLFGWNDKYQDLSNMPIDRILSINESKTTYSPNTKIDFEEYFEDLVGVTIKPGAQLEKVIIKVKNKLWPYIVSKPIHGSQKVKSRNESETIIELNLIINYELKSLLFSYMDGIEIIEPVSLRETFKAVSENIFLKYK